MYVHAYMHMHTIHTHTHTCCPAGFPASANSVKSSNALVKLTSIMSGKPSCEEKNSGRVVTL